MNYACIVNGERVLTEETLEVINPATGELVGHSPIADRLLLNSAVEAAAQAFKSWSIVADGERAAACEKLAGVLQDNLPELSKLLTQEQGKPLKGEGSEFEIGGCIGWTQYTASLSLPIKLIQDDDNARIEQRRVPLGVVGSITPWNWPLMIAIWHIMPAIRSGNTVVLKPSPYTPLSSLRMVELMQQVLPPGVLNIVAGRDELGQWISEHEGINKIVFTGSTATGKKVMRSAADNLKRLTLELGGNDAGIVLADADPKKIAAALFASATINNGQTCAALKRLYVHSSIYDSVCEELVTLANSVPMGNGLDEDVRQGPMQNSAQYHKVLELIADAKQQGARILCGGEAVVGPGFFIPYTIVADATAGMRLVAEEQFGPVLPVIRYEDLDDAIAEANDSDNGLGGSIWSADLDAAAQLATRLECGTAWVNNHGAIAPNCPFGGRKQSGFGVEFAQEGLEEYTAIQVVNVSKQ
jgi:acyl-CoA reductase-like NAD-dependent aldehyde dehydrogenase